MNAGQIKDFLRNQIPPGARRVSLLFAMQAAAYDTLRAAGAPEAEGARAAMDRLRRDAETLGAMPLGLAGLQTAAPSLMDQLLKMVD